ncbi:MAG: DNA primase [Endomicrobium sp.]|jgi:DNA primase|nr:DNA primase [Endomicrobium sp.]
MAIPEDTIENIRFLNNIELVVMEYLPNVKRIGRNLRTCCPFHNEKTPSFLVNSEKGIFKCFGCGISGDVFKFVMLINNISWLESVKKLAKRANIKIKFTNQNTVVESKKNKIFSMLEISAEFYNKHLLESRCAENARKYLYERGVTDATIDKFKIGYSSRNFVLDFFLKKNYKIEDLLNTGIITRTVRDNFFEYMSNRIVFPIFDVNGRVVAFGGRNIFGSGPKYLNTPETIVYSKSLNLYGLYQTLNDLQKKRRIIVLEGYMDAIILQQFGVGGAVATLGTSFNKNHVKLISRYSDNIVLLFDSDNAGRNATRRSLEILIENSIECSVSSLPEHVDADEYINKYGREKFLELVKNNSKNPINFMLEVYTDLFSENNKKIMSYERVKIISHALDFVAKCTNLILQGEWIKDISQYTNVDEKILWSEFKRRCKLDFKNRNCAQFYDNNTKILPFTIKNKTIVMSLEENLLNIILNNRNYANELNCDYFKSEKCRKVFSFIIAGFNNDEILNNLQGEYKDWFLELISSKIEQKNVKETIDIILKDIKINELKKKRLQLEKEILLISEGKKEKNDEIFYKYRELTAFLKGSTK